MSSDVEGMRIEDNLLCQDMVEVGVEEETVVGQVQGLKALERSSAPIDQRPEGGRLMPPGDSRITSVVLPFMDLCRHSFMGRMFVNEPRPQRGRWVGVVPWRT